MHFVGPLWAVATIWLVAAVTPGPNFLLTAQISAARSRAEGLGAVAGIGVATAIWGFAGLMGIQALFVAAPWFYAGFKIAGAAYLVLTGMLFLWRSSRSLEAELAPVPSGRRPAPGAAFRIGLVTSLANPRSALSVASIFAAALPQHASMTVGIAAIAVMTAISVGWYTFTVFFFTTGSMAALYRRLRRWTDRAAGLLLVWFGARLALDR
jgi:threonine/homoserine/homoserine lactone efflux protein